MNQRGINLEEVKKNNRVAILLELNRNGAMSRKNIAEAIGLTQASVSIIVGEMLAEGILVELGELAEEEKRAGRKKILVDINSEYKYAFCVGIESENTYLSLVNLRGEIKADYIIPTDRTIPAEEYLKTVCTKFKEMMWDNQIPNDKILAIGVSVPGPVDAVNGISERAYHVWKYSVPVKDIFEKELGIETLVENNVKAYALTEILLGNENNGDDIFLLKWGPGVGSALIIDNTLYSGATGRAGEIGHMIAKRGGKLCSCGSCGCLETEVSSSAMRAATSEEEIDEKISRFALTVRNTVRFLNPSKFVLIGYLFDNEEYYNKFIKFYKEFDPAVEDGFFVKSQLAAKDAHSEALAIVINRFL